VKKWNDKITGGEPQGSAFSVAVQPVMHDAYQVELKRRALTPDILGNTNDSDDPSLVAADGPLAKVLIAMGIRDVNNRWNVGDTPKGETA